MRSAIFHIMGLFSDGLTLAPDPVVKGTPRSADREIDIVFVGCRTLAITAPGRCRQERDSEPQHIPCQ